MLTNEFDRLSIGHPLGVGFQPLDIGPDRVDPGRDVCADVYCCHFSAIPLEYSGRMASFNFKQKPTGLFKRLLHAPVWLYRSRLGFLLGRRLVMLEHEGRRSGKLRRTPLEVVRRDGDSYIVCSGTGPNADWYRNLKAKPALALWVGSRRHEVEQRFLEDSEAATVLAQYESDHATAAARLMDLMGVSHDGTHDGRVTMMAKIPMVELRLAD